MASKRKLVEVDLSAQDDEEDGESGLLVRSLRIGASTQTNYRSGMKKIVEYYQKSTAWNCFVLPDNEHLSSNFPFKLKIPVLGLSEVMLWLLCCQTPREDHTQERKTSAQEEIGHHHS